MTNHSISPAGEKFAIPEESEYSEEFERVALLAEAARTKARKSLL